MRQRLIAAAIVVLVALSGLPASMLQAQSTGFITPGTSGRGFGIPDPDLLDETIKDARWRAGVVRLSPWLGLRDVANVATTGLGRGLDDDDDLTASLGAGLRAYLRSGPSVVFSAHVMPEYTWWADDDDRRQLNGRYGAGAFVYRNRIQLELSQRLVDRQEFFSSEIQRLSPGREAISRGLVNLRLVRNLWLALGGFRNRIKNREDGNALLSSLDRTEESLRARLDFRSPRGWRLGLGFEETEFRFDDNARNLSSDASGLVFEGLYEGNRFASLLQLQTRDLEPQPGSQLPRSEEFTGVLQAVIDLGPRSAVMGYARRNLSFSVRPGSSFFIAERIGSRWQTAVGSRFDFGLYAEAGEDRLEAAEDPVLARVDDVVSFGFEVNTEISDLVGLRLELQHTDISSPLPEFDRDTTLFGFSFQLRPLERLTRKVSERLRLGAVGDVW